MTEPDRMSADTARARFSDVVDGALPPAERAAFDAALAADEGLRAEWRAFEASVGAARRLRSADGPAPSLLPAVQRELRRRSRGRYYRDRFAERVGGRSLLGVAVLAVLVLVALAVGLAGIAWPPNAAPTDAAPPNAAPPDAALDRAPLRAPPPAAGAGR